MISNVDISVSDPDPQCIGTDPQFIGTDPQRKLRSESESRLKIYISQTLVNFVSCGKKY